ncbi:hypothetical protein AN1V17_17100 [Vallitalea sediminicola]
MEEKKEIVLVICSTLNQITNYLVIKFLEKKYSIKKIYNITYKDETKKYFNLNIKNNEWDKWLENMDIGIKINHYHIKDLFNIETMQEEIQDNIIKNCKKDEIYWHITGGQRTIALAVSNLMQEDDTRKNDKLMYIEGNSEKLILNNSQGKLLSNQYENYGYRDLDFETVLKLVGFNTKSNLKSTKVLKKKLKNPLKNDFEYKFYIELYKIILKEAEGKSNKYKIEYKDNKIVKVCEDSFRNLLLKSNAVKNSKDNHERREFIIKVFEVLMSEYEGLKDIGYDIINSHEVCAASYPAGYIFEKITSYVIYDLVKNNDSIVDMRTSLKTYFENENNDIVDELDIVLLKDTGKIINFECKSGGLKGDNAKSHNYTTYRLAGVFGMPLLLSPLFKKESIINTGTNKELKKQKLALNAAKNAELEVICFDELSTIEKLINDKL